MVNINHFKDPAVYALHAGDFLFHYVGSTSVNSKNRLYQHISRAQSGHSAPVYQWMRDVGVRNVQVVDLVKESDPELLDAFEISAIVQLRDEGHPLENVSWTRGLGATVLSPAERRRWDRTGSPVAKPKPVKQPKAVRGPRQPNHGSVTEWMKYHCKCEPCRLAGAQNNARKRGKPIPEAVRPLGVPDHGTANRYKHYDCRCEECRAAGARARKAILRSNNTQSAIPLNLAAAGFSHLKETPPCQP
jgi:hypothetical protein